MSRSKKNWDRMVKGDGSYYGDTRPGYDAPPNPLRGDMWINEADLVMRIWNGTTWVPVYGGGGSVPGAKGDQGPAGEKGRDGATGSPGANGAKGATGNTGEKGKQGRDGLKGDTGRIGNKGPAGAKGSTGPKGGHGLTGTKGPAGEKGPQGEKGTASGIFTFKGEVLTEGNLPPTGNDEGDVWKATDTGLYYAWNGTDWVEIGQLGALKGEPGTPGQKGAEGSKGNTGDKGSSGTNGEKGTTGSKGEGQQGQKGSTGATGADGQKGEAGTSVKGEPGDPGQSIKGEPGENGVFPEPNNDGFLYGRSVDPLDNASWLRTVEHSGDTMSGALVAPTLTTGPDLNDKAILKMDNASNAFNGGPHELEAKEKAGTDWDSWINYDGVPSGGWFSITYGQDQFVALAYNSYNSTQKSVMTSPDGMNWTGHSTPVDGIPGDQMHAICFGQDSSNSLLPANGLFVAVAQQGDTKGWIMTSPDGISWTMRSAPVSASASIRSVVYGNGIFVATGNNLILTSPDGINWTQRTAPSSKNWFSVTFGNGRFVAVAQASSSSVMYSINGISWTTVSPPSDCYWHAITFAQDPTNASLPASGLFVAVGFTGNSRTMTSPDGINWTASSSIGDASWYAVTYGDGRFVAVSPSGSPYGENQVATSPDGQTWTLYPAATPGNSYWSIAFGGGAFVAGVGQGGTPTTMVMTLVTSDDAAGLYFDDELIATRENINPLIDKVNENAIDVGVLQGSVSTVFTGTSLPSFRPSGEDLEDGDMFYLTSTSRLYVYFTNAWRQVTA